MAIQVKAAITKSSIRIRYKLENCNERIEWIKPIMFTAGLGMINDKDLYKNKAKEGMKICKNGGPVYKIGFGGSSASSRVNSAKTSQLDYYAVQRGDAEMERKMDNVIRACVELENNPIESIHDQGAGGNGNVLKEIIEDKGAIIDIGNLTMGQDNMTDIEIWLSEYQESNAILVRLENIPIIKNICDRESTQLDIVGTVKDKGITILNEKEIIVENYIVPDKIKTRNYYLDSNIKYPIRNDNLILQNKNNYILDNLITNTLSNLAVGSKRFLTNKVDRSVTGLIAQQQCVGPFHTPLSNYGLICQQTGRIEKEFLL